MQKSKALRRIVIPYSMIAHLSESDRYSLHLLGHIFNETMVLLKLAYTTSIKREDCTDAEVAASVCQATLFCRLLAGKIHEAQLRLNSKEVRVFLTNCCYPYVPDEAGPTLLAAFNTAASQCKWLNAARNGHSMHYPSLQHWQAALTTLSENKAGFELICGKLDGDILYHSSDAMAGLAFFHEVDPADWRTGAETMIRELQQLGDRLGEFIQTILRSFVLRAKDEFAGAVGSITVETLPPFYAPDFDHFEVPYFFSVSED
ncbi:hypothetical protein [Paraburkholderia acidipaludis]|uniref:hypothetical protein n=1 Tax=Paraburkholderia acidipaludis TaxID=660537 RepID=UPI00048564C8|nr:hypothetical protein [Paraburkholderia acidipaludis]